VARIPVFAARQVEAAVSPQRALDAVREAFVAYARGQWSMPPKVYVHAYPAGDFRAMPALGAGHAVLKWVTSFPGNPAVGLPTVTGLVLLSDASDGSLRAALDAGAVTALRTAAAAVLAAEELGRPDSATAAVIGAGINGQATARALVARGHDVMLWDVEAGRAEAAARQLEARVAGSRAEALKAELLITVTPGHELLLSAGSLRPGQHVSLMGADGPGKAEIAVEELARGRISADEGKADQPPSTAEPNARVRVFCDDWEQASHAGDLRNAVQAGLLGRADVTELGAVLAGTAPGRQAEDDITIFDSTGLAIQDLAIALAAIERVEELDLPTIDL
jgi:ornithine cyclodeaminase/alanine dehydrogenase-like protein (mu-crystallin family)